MVDIQDLIARITGQAGEDPALALATARVESGLDPRARGDRLADPRAVEGFCSFGLFQENVCGGAGTNHPLADLFDPTGATSRFADRARAARASGLTDPGAIAAAAQRPFDPTSYAAQVDALYPVYAKQLGTTGIAGDPNAGKQCRPGSKLINGVCHTAGGFGPAEDFLPVLPTPGSSTGGSSSSGSWVDQLIGGAADLAAGTVLNLAVVGAVLGLGYIGLRKAVA